jgi:signal transduction histidine kinase
VRDSGSGIAGDPDRIFDPFFTTKSDGMGLGLSICRSIIESQGGRIQASNNALHGATVAFTLPVSIPAEARWRARPHILI